MWLQLLTEWFKKSLGSLARVWQRKLHYRLGNNVQLALFLKLTFVLMDFR